ncbi:MAG TPA: hypothetical protein VIT68_04280 [Candidatus Gracilibacteria bacterium]
MSKKIKYIRYYDHDLFLEFSGIAVFDGEQWERKYKRFDPDDLEFLKVNHPEAEVQNAPLPDLSFG